MGWRIGEILIQKKLISWEQLQDALETQKITKGFTGDILVEKGYISRSLFYRALADQHNLQFVEISKIQINPEAIRAIPESVVKKFNLLPVEISSDRLIIGISNPVNLWPREEIQHLTKIHDIQTILCLPEDLEAAIEEHYGSDKVSQTT